MLFQQSITGHGGQSKKIPLDPQQFVDNDDMQEGDEIVHQSKYQKPTNVDDEDGGNED